MTDEYRSYLYRQLSAADPSKAIGEVQNGDIEELFYGAVNAGLISANRRSDNAIAAAISLAEVDAWNGVIPSRMATPPSVVFGKGFGVSTATVSAGGSGYAVNDQITLTGGTSQAQAILKVTSVNVGAVTGVSVIRSGLYSVKPTNPVAQGSTTGAGTGATFNLTYTTPSLALTPTYVDPTDAKMRFTGNGPTNINGSGYYGNSVDNGTHSSFEWSTNSQHVDIRLAGMNTNGVLFVDGKQVNKTGINTDASGENYVYALDFGASSWHTFRLVAFNNAFGGIYTDSGALVGPPMHTRPLAWSIGDSYTLGSGADNSASQSIMVMAERLGINVLPDGISGSGWNTGGANAPATRVQNKLATLTRQPSYVFVDLGYNDAGGNLTTLADSFDTTIAAIKLAAPSAKIIVFGPATPLGQTANLNAVRDVIKSHCASKKLLFIDVTDWVNANNSGRYTSNDNTHPSGVGHVYLGARRAEVLKDLI